MSEADVSLEGFGYYQAVAVTGDKTLAATDCGIVQDVTATCTITLPATALGDAYLIRVAARGITVTVAPAAADNIRGNGFTAANNKAAIATSQPIGSHLALLGEGTVAGGYAITAVRGTWTRAA